MTNDARTASEYDALTRLTAAGMIEDFDPELLDIDAVKDWAAESWSS